MAVMIMLVMVIMFFFHGDRQVVFQGDGDGEDRSGNYDSFKVIMYMIGSCFSFKMVIIMMVAVWDNYGDYSLILCQ